MRVVFAGSLQANATLFQAVMQDMPGCDGLVFSDSIAAWCECRENEPDLLLLDELIPPQNGMALLEKFRVHYADIPVLMVAGRGDHPLRLRALAMGASDFLGTPLDKVECAVRIKNLLDLRQTRQELAKRTSWLADEVNEAYRAMELNATQAQEITEIAETNLKLEEANRSKSDFLARISHDLRAPLATIMGYSDLLASHAHLAAHSGELAVIGRNAHHLLGLIDELLEFARNAIGGSQIRLAPVNFHELVEHVMQQAYVLAGASGNLVTLEKIGILPQVLVLDAVLVKRVLSNLLSNAAKFTRNGTVTLRVSAEDGSGIANQQVLLFEVIDSGAGIDEAEQERIFEPFYRAAPVAGKVPGTGLGLAICRQLAEAMGGRITLESAPGKGSRFLFHLTCLSASEADIGIADAAEFGEIHGAGQLILVVDDVADIRYYLGALLSRAGFRVIAAANGVEALRLLAQSLVMPVAVVTDQVMPEMDGWALLKALRMQYGASLPVILLSSMQPEPPVNWPENVQFDAALPKPAESGRLLSTLARVLQLAQIQTLADGGEIADCEMPLPDDAQLGKFRDWAEQGALSVLESEVVKLVGKFPEYAAFARFITARCEALDVEGIVTYCAKRLK